METPIPYNKDITYFAKTNFRNSETVFGIKRKDRRQHMYVLGKSGTGKSVLLSNLIAQNIQNGEGVCVVDPHGELVEEVLELIPPHRVKDVIYFNPADSDFHIGFNVIQLDDPKYKHLVASGLMGIFTKIWANAWSSRMEYILNNAILALLDTPGTTLLGIPRILVDKDYRQMIIGNLKDPVVKAFWVHEYEQWRDQFRNEAIAPIQNKVGQFLSTSIIRNVVGQPKSTINIFDIMNEGKIFLVNVSKGRVGEDNSALLGGMIITKIQLAAMERVRIPEDERKDFYLYVDEFQNFATDSFANILSEARKYRLNLIVAHQYTAQLVTKDGSAVRDAVFGNVGTMIIFRVGADDADFLEKEFEPEFMAQDLVNLPNYHIYLKLMIDGITSRPFSATTLPPIKVDRTENVKEKIIESSRKLYTRSREEVEDEILRWSGMVQTSGPQGEGMKYKATCDSCGKEIMVPFEPQPGKPVYCKECLLKIKEGDIVPAKGFIAPKAFKQEQINASPLAALGIEFSQDGTKAPAMKSEQVGSSNNKTSIPYNHAPSAVGNSNGVSTNNNPRPKFTPNINSNSNNHNQVAPFVPKKKSGPSPLLKGLLEQIDAEKKGTLPTGIVPPVVEIKKEVPKPMSLSSLKAKNETSIKTEEEKKIFDKPVAVGKEANPEKMNLLKDILAKASVPVVDTTPKPTPVITQAQPQISVPTQNPVQIPTPTPVQIKTPTPTPAPTPIPTPTVNPTPIPQPKVTPIQNINSDQVPAPKNEDSVVNKDNAWQKRVAVKEVPEEVLQKILE